ncbi:MAG: hypothetical protein B0A82_26905 [Alkalinema sp. CACIAM 70d]|nr:MAG: hypothetical protein B0A82_26905 [Alkalinema sp. CACIAM 70d]
MAFSASLGSGLGLGYGAACFWGLAWGLGLVGWAAFGRGVDVFGVVVAVAVSVAWVDWAVVVVSVAWALEDWAGVSLEFFGVRGVRFPVA